MAGLLTFVPGLAFGAGQGSLAGQGAVRLLAEPETRTYEYLGATQSFTVPENTCSVTVDAYGAEGGAGHNSNGRRASGGRGGRASAAIEVEPGEVLLISVGGHGLGRLGGYNGGGDGGDMRQDDGGGGGGASDVRRAPFDLVDRLIVGGGGGGGGGDADGGDFTTGNGGGGGGLEGEPGRASSSTPPSSPGQGGTQTEGGAPGSGDSTARAGARGTGGQGGLGGSRHDTGGGGGGGWFGGGGGAGEDDNQDTDGGGGGGGGSSYGPSGVEFRTGVHSGNGLVDITWQVGMCEEISFDWTMPDRFGFDQNGDGLMDYYPPTGSLQIEPDGWRVDFIDTSRLGCDQSLWRKWFVNGVEVVAVAPEVIFYSRASCNFAYKFPSEGIYGVRLEVRDGSNNLVGSYTDDVIVQDWLIVLIGDSIASGEGVPEIKAQQAGSPRWQSQRCHRSALAGGAWAARQIERADPRTSVTFVHLACSGAQITEGLLSGYEGIESGGGEPAPTSQVEQIRQLAPNREVDAVLMSVGANDVRFGYIAKFCALWYDCHTGMGGATFAIASSFLPGRYQELGAKLAGSSGIPGLPNRRIYLTEYADPTRYDDSSICGSELFATPGEYSDELLHDLPGSPVIGVSEAEAAWASNVMVAQLNQMGQAGAAANGWSYIGGIMLETRFHGYCANETWIVPYVASQSDQGNSDGTLHPNVLGHLLYATRIVERLTLDFYAGGNLAVPRGPGT